MKTYIRLILIALLVLTTAALIAYYTYVQPSYVKPPELSGSLTEQSLNYFGHRRTFQVYMPEYLSKSPDLIYVLHGSTGSGLEIREQMAYEFDLIAEEGNAVVVYPDGFKNHWNDCRASADYEAKLRKIDDIGFFKKIEKQVGKEMQLNFKDIFVVGLSNGGHMAFKLAMEAPDWVTAIAAIAANLPVNPNNDCQSIGLPAAVLIMNGTKDPVNPYNGGEVNLFGAGASRGQVMATWETTDYWTSLAKQEGEPKIVELENVNRSDGSEVYLSLWRSPGALPVAVYTIEGGGHTIPHPRSSLPGLLGKTNRDINAPREIWNFFR